MSTNTLIIIIAASVLFVICFVFVISKVSIARKKKKTMTGELAKKLAKIQKEQEKENYKKQKDEFILQEKQYQPVPQKKHGVKPIVADYDESLDGSLEVEAQQEEKQEPPKRKSFEELMKARAERQQAEPQPIVEEMPDDFEEFRNNHSVYTSYKSDPDLIEEIQNLSPELKAIVFGNLFRRVSDD